MVKDDRKFQHCFESYGTRLRIASNSRETLEAAVRTADEALLGNTRPIDCETAEHEFRLISGPEQCDVFQDGKFMVGGEPDAKFWRFFDSLVRIIVAEFSSNWVFVHAGVVGWKGKALLFPASSFHGKSTLVTELVKCGAVYYSDEYAVLNENGLVEPFARAIARRTKKSPVREIPTPVTSFGGIVGTEPLPVGLVLFTRFEADAEWAPEIMSQGAGVMELMLHTIPLNADPERSLKVLKLATNDAIIAQSLRPGADKFAPQLLEFVDNTTF